MLILDQIFGLMDENLINQRINMPLDVAFSCFVLPEKKDITHEGFNLILSEFYQHINRFGMNAKELSRDEALQEIMWFVERHYRNQESIGYDGAYLDAIHNSYEFVFEKIVEAMKSVEKEKYMNWIFAAVIDPTDWDIKRKLVKEIRERYGHLFPPDMQKLSIGQLMNNLEKVIFLVL